ncbi:hypothetical protein GNF51_14530 [Clostridium perfringens]|uniref:hypothetical protein n=1 Tax=Clostridium perfringens TaxID=1502 RepID=UPI002AC6EEAA|nr:hypothetical protein [Clostridium perfringens]MDZ4956994.1 hypothetical protein [Clostridium perfringens]
MDNNLTNDTNNDINYDKYSQPMTLKDWIITLLLMLIPIANIVLMFVWAFGSNVNKSKKTYFQASLIMTAIGIVFFLIFGSVIFGALLSYAY